MHRSVTYCLAAFAGCLGVAAAACGDDSSSSAYKTPPGEEAGTPLGDSASADGGASSIAKGPSQGSAIAISADDSVVVVANRDVGSITVLRMTYPAGGAPATEAKTEVDLGAGSEPWQVAIAPDGDTAYVVLRKSQKLVKVTGLRTAPVKAGEVATGSEPTGLALTPTGGRAYVANWVDGTVIGIDTKTLQVAQTIDLNKALADSTLLGSVASRPALAHPRSLAITNNGNASDDDETIYVTEYFAQRIAPEAVDGANVDTSKAGQVYRVAVSSGATSLVRLAPLADIGFKDENNVAAGCFPNQLQSIALADHYAYVVSICASPKGPTGPKITATACTTADDCTGLVSPVCIKPDTSSANAVCVDTASVRTTTQPVVSVIDTNTGQEVSAATANLNARFRELYQTASAPDDGTRRYPLVANDIAFVPGTTIAYVSANGADAVFRVRFDAATGAIAEVGSTASKFIDLAPSAAPAEKQGKNPVGLAVSNSGKGLLFVANEVTRNVSTIDLNLQSLVGGASPVTFDTAAKPAPGSNEDRVLKGKRFFNTGVGRWSLKGQGWGACQSCHQDGLTDNVTWYFARGPRQSTSLDGSYSKKDASDRRIFNWTGMFDELADFEGNTRGVSGGVGAIVKATSAPPATADRINLANPASSGQSHAGLNGSVALLADMSNPLSLPDEEKSRIDDWVNIEAYVKQVRSPRAPTNLDAAKITTGRQLFEQKNCQGCHGGDKWTISKVFWTPSPSNNTALKSASWGDAATNAGFPSALFPATGSNRLMRFDSGNPAALDQIQCILRPVGTFNVAESGVGIAELRVNMTAAAQGNEADGKGYNPPSLLGLATGAPYLHAGNARTLESLLTDTFKLHHQALAVNFLDSSDQAAADQRAALVQFLLSIDADATTVAIPNVGPTGGNFCSQ